MVVYVSKPTPSQKCLTLMMKGLAQWSVVKTLCFQCRDHSVGYLVWQLRSQCQLTKKKETSKLGTTSNKQPTRLSQESKPSAAASQMRLLLGAYPCSPTASLSPSSCWWRADQVLGCCCLIPINIKYKAYTL